MSRSVNVPEVLMGAVLKTWNSEPIWWAACAPHGAMSVPITEEELFVVWSAKVLQNWKGLVGSTRPGSPYFEVTHNGNNGVTYVDVYKKINNMSLYNGQLIGQQTKGENK